MQVLHVDLEQQVLGIVVAVDADPRDREQPGERADPRPVEVAEADDGIDAHLLRHERGVERRRLVRQGEDAHAGSLDGRFREGAPGVRTRGIGHLNGGGADEGPAAGQAQTGVGATASSGFFSSSSGVAGTSSRHLIGSLSCTTWRTM